MQEELIDTVGKLHRLPLHTLKTYDSSRIILQYQNNIMQIDASSLEKLTNDRSEIDRCYEFLKNKTCTEYILVAYYDGKIAVSKRTLPDPQIN